MNWNLRYAEESSSDEHQAKIDNIVDSMLRRQEEIARLSDFIEKTFKKSNTDDRPHSIPLPCIKCGTPQNIQVNDKELEKLHHYVQTRAGNIQDILPDHTPGEREMFLSGICNPCWQEMFKE